MSDGKDTYCIEDVYIRNVDGITVRTIKLRESRSFLCEDRFDTYLKAFGTYLKAVSAWREYSLRR